MNEAAKLPATFREAFRFWLKLGFTLFGGHAGQIAITQKNNPPVPNQTASAIISALLATYATFVPSFFFIFIAAGGLLGLAKYLIFG